MELKIFYGVILVMLITTGIVVGGLYLFAHPLTEPAARYDSVAVAVAVATPIPAPTATLIPIATTLPVLGSSTETIEPFSTDKLYSLINAYRRENKLSILKIHPLLEKSARDKLTDMLEEQYWTHEDPQGRPSWYLLETAGYHYERAGENISTSLNSPWQVFTAWRESQLHDKELIEPAYEHMGIAVDCTSYQTAGKNACVVVLHLGRQLL